MHFGDVFRHISGVDFQDVQFLTERNFKWKSIPIIWLQSDSVTFPKTNIAPENRPSQKETVFQLKFILNSNHHFSGVMIISGRVTKAIGFEPNKNDKPHVLCTVNDQGPLGQCSICATFKRIIIPSQYLAYYGCFPSIDMHLIQNSGIPQQP